MQKHQEETEAQTGFFQRALSWIDVLIPPGMRAASPDELRRTRLVVGFSAAFVVSALISIAMTPYVGASVPAVVLVAGVFFHGTNLILLWIFRSRRLASIVFLCTALYVTGHITYLWGGLYSPGFHWHITMPLLALFLLGRRWGVVFFCVSFVQATVFYLLYHFQVPIPVVDAKEQALGYYTSVCNLFGVAFFVVWLYDSARDNMLKALKESLESNLAMAAERDEERLANEAKSAFLAHMSHELRTPLNAIIGYAELVQEELPGFDADELSPELDNITSAGRGLLAMIQDILDISQLDAGQIELRMAGFDVGALLQEALLQAAPLVEQRGNTFEADFGPDLGAMLTDRSRLQQCLEHLLSNAAKFTENGQVWLRARRIETLDESRASTEGVEGEGPWLEFQVEDTGIGMAQEMIEHLFQKFTQGDSSTTKKYGGAGLGLVICQGLARLMGGELALQSEPGKGTTATLLIPVKMPKAFA